jgi:hypothetical protein
LCLYSKRELVLSRSHIMPYPISPHFPTAHASNTKQTPSRIPAYPLHIRFITYSLYLAVAFNKNCQTQNPASHISASLPLRTHPHESERRSLFASRLQSNFLKKNTGQCTTTTYNTYEEEWASPSDHRGILVTPCTQNIAQEGKY